MNESGGVGGGKSCSQDEACWSIGEESSFEKVLLDFVIFGFFLMFLGKDEWGKKRSGIFMEAQMIERQAWVWCFWVDGWWKLCLCEIEKRNDDQIF